MKGKNESIVLNSKQIITIFNILRAIGLNTSHRGTKYINKAVQLLIVTALQIKLSLKKLLEL